MARSLGFERDIFVPSGMVRARIEAMEREGATVTVTAGGGSDDEVPTQLALLNSPEGLPLQPTSPGT